MQTVIFYYRICQHEYERRQTVHKISLLEIWFGQICVGSQHCVLYWGAKQTTLRAHTLSKWLTCKLHVEWINLFFFLIWAVFPVIFYCYNASKRLSLIDVKRSRCNICTLIRSKQQGNGHSDTVAPSHYSGDTHLHASPWQHIKPYVLYEEGL